MAIKVSFEPILICMAQFLILQTGYENKITFMLLFIILFYLYFVYLAYFILNSSHVSENAI